MRADLKAAIDGSASSVAIGARARMSSQSDQPMENAATIPIDLRSMTSIAAEMKPTASKVTPIGTEALDALPAGVPSRWTGYAIATALIAAVGFGGFQLYKAYKHASIANANETPTASNTAAIDTPLPTTTHPIITPDNPQPTTTSSSTTLPVIATIPSGHVAPITASATRPARA